MQHFRNPPECGTEHPMFWTPEEARNIIQQCDYEKVVQMYGGFDIVHKILREASVGRVSDDTLDELDTALGRYSFEGDDWEYHTNSMLFRLLRCIRSEVEEEIFHQDLPSLEQAIAIVSLERGLSVAKVKEHYFRALRLGAKF